MATLQLNTFLLLLYTAACCSMTATSLRVALSDCFFIVPVPPRLTKPWRLWGIPFNHWGSNNTIVLWHGLPDCLREA